MKKNKRNRGDEWTFHINDWMDNSTFHYEEEEEWEAEEPAEEIPAPDNKNLSSTNHFKSTGRFDQFNDEFDGNFDGHQQDFDHQADAPMGTDKNLDEYADEDPYKIEPRDPQH